LYDPTRRLVIEDISIVVSTALSATPTVVNVGTVADPDAVVDAQSTTASAIHGATQSFTLETTLQDLKRQEARGKPVLPAGTPLLLSHDGAGTGTVSFVVTYYVIDRDGKIE
jgi:hypothetical protein